MSELGDDFKAFKEHKQAIRMKEEPVRFGYAIRQFEEIGIMFKIDGDKFVVPYLSGFLHFFPYTGWFCGLKPYGKIKGRGINNLIKALSENKHKESQCPTR
jgi:hypothetical protein